MASLFYVAFELQEGSSYSKHFWGFFACRIYLDSHSEVPVSDICGTPPSAFLGYQPWYGICILLRQKILSRDMEGKSGTGQRGGTRLESNFERRRFQTRLAWSERKKDVQQHRVSERETKPRPSQGLSSLCENAAPQNSEDLLSNHSLGVCQQVSRV